jgi:hypothetical protein
MIVVQGKPGQKVLETPISTKKKEKAGMVWWHGPVMTAMWIEYRLAQE